MKSKNNRFLAIALALILLASSILACGAEATAAPDSEANATDESSSSATNEPTNPAAEPVAQGEPGTWLVMMYEDADDQVLEEDMFIDMNEAEVVGSTDQVKIVAQMDRFKGAFDGGGDVTSTKRYLLTQDNDLNTINSPELADLGEVNMGDKNTLIDFATWAMATYPAEHYVLILSDHGAGWTGGWSDDDPQQGGNLSMQNIDDALGAIISQTGIAAFDLVGFDACLMGQLEVMSAIAPHAKYAVGSEETEPALGWAYSSFLQALNDNTAMTGGELGQAIVDSYVAQDIRITDDQARSVFAGGNFTQDSVAASLSKDITLTAVDLSAVSNLNAAVNDLAVSLTSVDQEKVAEARAYAQSYTSIFGDEVPPSYIDLGHFVNLLAENIDDAAVKQAAEKVQSALKQAVVAEKHGDEKPASSGLTIYFPNSVLYQNTVVEPAYGLLYAAYVGRFATASLWDDFLTFHYTGKDFDPAAADLAVLTPAESAQSDFAPAVEESAPQSGAEIVPPGAGALTIAPLEVSANEIGPDDTVNISTEITGSNVGYVYIYVSYYDEESKSYLTADMDFIDAENTKESGGINYPDWGNDATIPISFDWEPTLYYMSDGNEANDQFAFFEPTIYGVDTKSDIYTVRGLYTYTEDGTEVESVMEFNGDGEMQNIFGFDGEGGSGAPHQITPQAGDTFTIYEEWLEFDQNPDGELTDYLGGTMTFGDTPLEYVPYYAYSGSYTLGIVVEDLNGNRTAEYTEVVVTP